MYTIEQYTALCNSIAQGATVVQYSDKKVEYRSLAEMLAIKRLMEQELGIGEFAPTAQSRRRVAIYEKGV